MYPYSVEELAWAAARAIKEEVQQTRSGSVEKAEALSLYLLPALSQPR